MEDLVPKQVKKEKFVEEHKTFELDMAFIYGKELNGNPIKKI